MSSKAPARKKRKVSSKSPSVTEKASEQPEGQSPANLGQEIRNIVSEIIPSIVPAITQSVVSSLTQLGVIPKPSATVTQPPLDPLEKDNGLNAAYQGDQPLQINQHNQLPNEQIRAQDEIAHTDLPEHKLVSMARPLGLGIDSKIKDKIWANQYVELHTLLSTKKTDKIEFVDNGDGFLKCKKSNSAAIKTFDKWLEAFHTFVAIYSSKFPKETPNLMRHATIVQRLSKQAGDEAALFYDEHFRLWRQDNPEYLPWGQLNSELQNEALAMGFSEKHNQPFQNKSKQAGSSKPYCFRYNNSNGHCPRQNCPFQHKCQKCGGSHSKKQCTSKPINNDSNTKRNPLSTVPAASKART